MFLLYQQLEQVSSESFPPKILCGVGLHGSVTESKFANEVSDMLKLTQPRTAMYLVMILAQGLVRGYSESYFIDMHY